MNLFAYCGNSPVMYADPTGEIFGALLVGFLLGGLISGSINAVSAAFKGENWIGAFVGGFITGAAMGVAAVLGGGLAVGAIKVTALNIGLISAYTTVGTFGLGMASYYAENFINNTPTDINSALKNGAITMTQGILSLGIGAAMGSAGFYDCLKPGNSMLDIIKISSNICQATFGKGGVKAIFYGVMSYMSENLYPMIVRSFMKAIFTSPWNLIKF